MWKNQNDTRLHLTFERFPRQDFQYLSWMTQKAYRETISLRDKLRQEA